jgi:hypothetical protein
MFFRGIVCLEGSSAIICNDNPSTMFGVTGHTLQSYMRYVYFKENLALPGSFIEKEEIFPFEECLCSTLKFLDIFTFFSKRAELTSFL